MEMFYVVNICVIQLVLTFNWGIGMLCKARHNMKPESVHIHIHQASVHDESFPPKLPTQPQQILLRMTFLWIESKSKLKISFTIPISYSSFDFDFDFQFWNHFDFDFDSNIGKNFDFDYQPCDTVTIF
jgi:hypothetical protein